MGTDPRLSQAVRSTLVMTPEYHKLDVYTLLAWPARNVLLVIITTTA